MATRTIEWRDGTIATIDQTKLPSQIVTLIMKNPEEVAEAIKNMKMRGAPLLGVAAGFALALAAYHSKAKSNETLLEDLKDAADTIRRTRPTAVNLFWALDRIIGSAKDFAGPTKDLAAFVVSEAQRIADEDAMANHMIGQQGAGLLNDGDVILTHCNAGALATVEYGTALGVVRAAWEQRKKIRVIATETRPLLQGARLTTWELKRDDIPVTLITDNMVGYVVHRGLINKVIVGADRIVRDAVINKIGTFTVAVLAKTHNVPFYVAAPKSTFDLAHSSRDIVIEERKPEEVTHIGSHRIATEGVGVMNPAFDITPLEYVTAIIYESGILYKKDFDNFRAGFLR